MAKPTIAEQLTRAARHGIKYEYRHENVKEGQFTAIDTATGREWSRGTGDGILRLIHTLVRYKERGKALPNEQALRQGES